MYSTLVYALYQSYNRHQSILYTSPYSALAYTLHQPSLYTKSRSTFYSSVYRTLHVSIIYSKSILYTSLYSTLVDTLHQHILYTSLYSMYTSPYSTIECTLHQSMFYTSLYCTLAYNLHQSIVSTLALRGPKIQHVHISGLTFLLGKLE